MSGSNRPALGVAATLRDWENRQQSADDGRRSSQQRQQVPPESAVPTPASNRHETSAPTNSQSTLASSDIDGQRRREPEEAENPDRLEMKQSGGGTPAALLRLLGGCDVQLRACVLDIFPMTETELMKRALDVVAKTGANERRFIESKSRMALKLGCPTTFGRDIDDQVEARMKEIRRTFAQRKVEADRQKIESEALQMNADMRASMFRLQEDYDVRLRTCMMNTSPMTETKRMQRAFDIVAEAGARERRLIENKRSFSIKLGCPTTFDKEVDDQVAMHEARIEGIRRIFAQRNEELARRRQAEFAAREAAEAREREAQERKARECEHEEREVRLQLQAQSQAADRRGKGKGTSLRGASLANKIEELCYRACTQSEDLAPILKVCQQASQDVPQAKEALATLMRIFCDGGPRHVRLSAARLWTIMLHNCSGEFLAQTCSPSFLAVIKDMIDRRQPGHPLSDRLIKTVGEFVYLWRLQLQHPLAVLYLQIKPRGYPENGLPPNWFDYQAAGAISKTVLRPAEFNPVGNAGDDSRSSALQHAIPSIEPRISLADRKGAFSPPWVSVAKMASAIPKAFESTIGSLFESLKVMRESNVTMNIPIADFCSQIVRLPRSESGKVIKLTRRRSLGTVTHEFLILRAVTPDGLPIWIRLDRRPLSGQRKALFLLTSAATASDSAIFAASELPLMGKEVSKVDAVVPFQDPPSLHDLGKLLWFIETEAPEYRLRKENCWFFCSVIQDVLTEMFRGHNDLGSVAHPELGKYVREKIFARARGAEGLKSENSE